VGRTQPTISGFADARRWLARDHSPPLEARKAKERDYPQSLQKGTQPHQHLQ